MSIKDDIHALDEQFPHLVGAFRRERPHRPLPGRPKGPQPTKCGNCGVCKNCYHREYMRRRNDQRDHLSPAARCGTIK